MHTSRPGRRFALLATGVALAALAALVSPSPAAADDPSYVALGDSYSSGTGTRSYLADGTSCQRSVYAYPSLIASAQHYALNFRACSGATIADVTATQLSALSASTTYVTISVGGNDAGFASVLTECALPGWMSNCNGRISTAQGFITTTLPGRLSTLYGKIRAAAPQARVTVVGYPRLFDGRDCNALTWFSSSEMSKLNATADLMNSRLSAAAGAAGFSVANPTSRVLGHAVCDSPEWINGLSYPISESYHPKVSGHRSGYYPTVSPYVAGVTAALTRTVLLRAAMSAPSLAAQQRAYAGLDARITPQAFRAPDLPGRRAVRAARRAGVDLSSRASIDRVDRIYSARQARAWARTH
ncbi:SGNH/GDSL hydrolase family protein [Nocardioides sp.]|uniref:SGNH/GDSL hydrolase family protein n=1 Tax=Nocardioides sp. TaxID=35761 RepID=UPI00352936C8